MQPILLDYGKGLLSGAEARKLTAHLGRCEECAVLLQEELAFARTLSALPMEQPTNDVWALVRTRTRPRIIRPLAWLRGLSDSSAAFKRTIAATAVAAVAAVTVYSFTLVQTPRDEVVQPAPRPVVAIKWSDDPLGNHTDALVDCIDGM